MHKRRCTSSTSSRLTVIILGWSLSGHIGIELMPLLGSRLKGLMIVGTPPVPREKPELGFYIGDGHMGAVEAETLKSDEVDAFARAVAGERFGGRYEDRHRTDVARTEGRARSEMWAAFRAGEGLDQKDVVEKEKEVCVAVVNGAEEPFVSLDFLDELKWGRLFKRKCVRLKGLGHAPFWENFGVFEPVFREFVDN